ncbi:MAG: sensor histidine kinase [Lachnotalea sp.]
MDWEGHISLLIEEMPYSYQIIIQDNGVGISQERLVEIRSGQCKSDENEDNSNGIGLGNVIERLNLYYRQGNLFTIVSEGKNKGIMVTIKIPKERGHQDV